MRLALFRLSENAYQLVWTQHHLILDAWSGNLVFKEAFAFYEAFSAAVPLELGSVRPYRDYIAWQQSQDASKAELFWRQLLKGFKAPVQLAIDRGPGNLQGQDADFQQERLKLSGGLTAALQTLAKDHRLTLNTFLQGAWALLLSQYSGRSDVIFGAVVFGLPPAVKGVESMAGLFINTLPFRARIHAQDTPLFWLESLQQQLVQIQQYDY